MQSQGSKFASLSNFCSRTNINFLQPWLANLSTLPTTQLLLVSSSNPVSQLIFVFVIRLLCPAHLGRFVYYILAVLLFPQNNLVLHDLGLGCRTRGSFSAFLHHMVGYSCPKQTRSSTCHRLKSKLKIIGKQAPVQI